MTKRICKVDGCGKPHWGRGYCVMHLRRVQRNGSTEKINAANRKRPENHAPSGSAIAFCIMAINSNTDDCILWPYSQHPSGYGKITVNERTYGSHNYVCRQANGEPPVGKRCALHVPKACHNRLCVNPRHLYWGNRKDNASDRYEDGTILYGADNHRYGS